VSYAYKGQLVRGVTFEELRSFLTSVLVRIPRSRTVGEWLRALVTREPTAGVVKPARAKTD